MSTDKTALDLVRDLALGRTSRRDFVRKALALGMSAGVIGGVLQACDGEEKKAAPEAPKPPEAKAEPPAEAELGPIEAELHIYNWSDYIAEDTVANFEAEFKVKVTYDTYEANEEMIAKLQLGGGGYDLVCPSGYAITVLEKLGLMDTLSKKYIPNLSNIAPTFAKTAYDPDQKYAVPWQWGITGLAFRKDKVAAPPDSWAVFHDAALKGKLTQMDDMRDAIGAWLRFRGKSLNSVDPADLAAAKADALLAKPNLKSYISAPVKGMLVAGDVYVAQLWNGDTMQAKAENENIDFAIPKEGAAIWCDAMVIPKGAKNKRAAHEFLNYILRADVGQKISEFTGYGSPNAAATTAMGAAAVAYPSDEQMKILEYQMDIGEGTALWDQVWTEIKSG
jgi:spermidine/putrescine transport system substrate-binding protein